jgi:hypothetical protein
MNGLDRILTTGLAITDALTEWPASGDEIAKATGVPRSTAYRYLHALTIAGRAQRVRYGWRLPTADELLDAKDGPALRDGFTKPEGACTPW